MKFLKNFFNDNSVIIGLCAFKQMAPKYYQEVDEHQFFFNPYQFNNPAETKWETNFETNILL